MKPSIVYKRNFTIIQDLLKHKHASMVDYIVNLIQGRKKDLQTRIEILQLIGQAKLGVINPKTINIINKIEDLIENDTIINDVFNQDDINEIQNSLNQTKLENENHISEPSPHINLYNPECIQVFT